MSTDFLPVKIYTGSFCPYCQAAKALFNRLNVPFEEISLDGKDDLRLQLSKENKGWRTVPMIFAGTRFLGGFDDINTLHQKDQLLPLLTGTPDAPLSAKI